MELVLWNRKWPNIGSDEYFNVLGHNIIEYFVTPLTEAEIITPEFTILDMDKGYACIDTGAFLVNERYPNSGKLTCLEFPTMKLYQQENIEKVWRKEQ